MKLNTYVSIKVHRNVNAALKGMAYPGESVSHLLERLLPAIDRANRSQIKELTRPPKKRLESGELRRTADTETGAG